MNLFANALSAALERCIASKHITEHKRPVGFLYREAPVFEQDGGWRFFSGGETDEFTDNPDNFSICSLSEIVERNPAVRPLLQEQAGAWEMNGDGEFVPAEEWAPQD